MDVNHVLYTQWCFCRQGSRPKTNSTHTQHVWPIFTTTFKPFHALTVQTHSFTQTQTHTHHRVKTLSISGSIHFIRRWNSKHVKRNHGDVKNYHFLLPWEHVSDDQ